MDDTVPEALRSLLSGYDGLAVAFSGGTDSTYLLYAAMKCGVRVRAYTVRSGFQPRSETGLAVRTAGMLGAEQRLIDIDVLSDTSIASNPEDRCYLCKNLIFSTIISCASKDDFDTVADGTNASDDPSGRPGMRALGELGVVSPLRICGITKQQVRELSRKAGLETWDMPSNSCLATRIPHGMAITKELLERTERAEEELRTLGLRGFRVRTTDSGARLETTAADSGLLGSKRSLVEEILLKYYPSVSYSERKPAP